MLYRIILASLVVSALLGAKDGGNKPPNPPGQGVSLRVSQSTVPRGAVTQIQVSLTEPKPIIKTRLTMDGLDEEFLDILGIAVYSPRGEAWGVARRENGRLIVEVSSPTGDLGRAPDYPILTIAVRAANLSPGQSLPVVLDLSRSEFFDRLGIPYPSEVKQGSITEGGSLAVDNVLPGGGLLKPDQEFRIEGHGFDAATEVRIEGVERLAYTVASPTLIVLSAPAAFRLDGAEVDVRNGARERVQYFSYLRAPRSVESAHALLNSVKPLFPGVESTQAAISPAVFEGAQYTAVAFENPSATVAELSVHLVSSFGEVIGSWSGTLAAGSRSALGIDEMFPGQTIPPASSLRVLSNIPMRAMGLLVNEITNSVAPVPPQL